MYPNEPNEQPPASVGGQGWPWALPKVKYLWPALSRLSSTRRPTLMPAFKPANLSPTSRPRPNKKQNKQSPAYRDLSYSHYVAIAYSSLLNIINPTVLVSVFFVSSVLIGDFVCIANRHSRTYARSKARSKLDSNYFHPRMKVSWIVSSTDETVQDSFIHGWNYGWN